MTYQHILSSDAEQVATLELRQPEARDGRAVTMAWRASSARRSTMILPANLRLAAREARFVFSWRGISLK